MVGLEYSANMEGAHEDTGLMEYAGTH